MPKKGNITGHPFDIGVRKQIEVREKYLGANPRADRHLLLSSNQNAWLRLASSIKIEDFIPPEGSTTNNGQVLTAAKILEQRKLPITLDGSKLAQKAVLFGGVSGYNPQNGSFQAYAGVADPFNLNDPFTAAYGWGGITENGYRPMPGIQSANITFYNRGALMKADISIKVFSIEQLQVFDLLYFRIGYTMLLEWGHTLYPGNIFNSQIGDYPLVERKDYSTEPLNVFFQEQGVTQNNVLDAIKRERLKSSYNYDGMLGKIVNFNWKFNADGTYDISLQLISLGDIIEALKINTTSVDKPKNIVTPSNKLGSKAKTLSSLTSGLTAQRETNAQTDISTDNSNETASTNTSNELAAAEKDLFGDPLSTPPVRGKADIAQEVITSFASNYSSFKDIPITEIKTQSQAQNVLNIIATYNKTPDVIIFNSPAVQNNWFNAVIRYEKANNASNSLEKGIETQDKNRETRDNQLELAEAAVEAAERALEAEKERQELAPESAAEYANRSKFNFQLYSWIEELQKIDKISHELNPKFDPKKYEDQKQVYPYSVAAAGAYISKTKTLNLIKLDFQSPSSVAGYDPQSYQQYYVRLGYLLEWVEDNLLLYSILASNDISATDTKKKTPYITIDTDPYANFCLRFPTQISTDPQMCVIPILYNGSATKIQETTDNSGVVKRETKPVELNWQYLTGKRNKFEKGRKVAEEPSTAPNLTSYFINPVSELTLDVIQKGFVALKSSTIKGEDINESNTVEQLLQKEGIPTTDLQMDKKGRVMNIMVNIDHVARILKENVDADGRVVLISFFSALFESINDCLGNVNKLEAVYDADDNKIKIIEATNVNDDEDLTSGLQTGNEVIVPPIAVFNVFGLPTDKAIDPSGIARKGSFVTNVDFQVQLPPKFAQMATISARSQGANIPGENATSISRLNYGLTDRVIKEKLDAQTIGLPSTSSALDVNLVFGDKLNQMNTFVAELYGSRRYVAENVDSLKSINRDVSLFAVGSDALKGKGPSPFFIPFNLALEMDGLSGMKNYERFAITEQILPYSYRAGDQGGVIDFLIKGISHTISDGKWKTKIESLAVASNRKNKKI